MAEVVAHAEEAAVVAVLPVEQAGSLLQVLLVVALAQVSQLVGDQAVVALVGLADVPAVEAVMVQALLVVIQIL